MAELLADESRPLPSWLVPVGREACLARLEAMSLWPARWPRLNQLALASVVAALSLIFYKLGLILVIVGLALVGYRFLATPALRAR